MIRAGIARVGAVTAQYVPAAWQGRLGAWVSSRRSAGPAERQAKQELVWADSASAGDLGTVSLDKALAMVRYAGINVPYYRSLFARTGIRPEEIRTLDQFREIPLLQRSDVMGDPEAFASEDRAIGRQLPMTTGGSTGIPLRFSVEPQQSALERTFFHHYWGKILGYRPGDRIVRLRGEVLPGGRMKFYDVADNSLSLSVYHLTDEILDSYLAWIERFRPAFFHVYPSSMYEFARLLGERGRNLRHLGLRGVLAGSENLYTFQRQVIEAVTGARVYSWYGHAEGAALAFECEHSPEYHFVPTYGYVEFLDLGGRPAVRDGEIVEIVASGFLNRASPFLRYRTLDHGVFSAGPCACGRSFPRLRRIEGRLQELIVSSEGRRISMTAMNMHNDTFDNVVRFQFRQRERGKVDLLLVTGPGFGEIDLHRIRSEVQKKLGEDMALTILQVGEIPRSRSGKMSFLIQEIPEVARMTPGEGEVV